MLVMYLHESDIAQGIQAEISSMRVELKSTVSPSAKVFPTIKVDLPQQMSLQLL